jgi:hypothetical protein
MVPVAQYAANLRFPGPLGAGVDRLFTKAQKRLLAVVHADRRDAGLKTICLIRLFECVDVMPDLKFGWGKANRSCHVSTIAIDKWKYYMITNLLTSPAPTKERPILFSAPMVRALLDGSKTQTRRIYKNRKHPDSGCNMAASELVREPQHVIDRVSPYGQAGDRLWVKETWSEVGTMDPGLIVYRADYPACVPAEYQNAPPPAEIKWKSSLFMRRTASRILLEIVSVRVERLQDISEADAVAEGVVKFSDNFINGISGWKGYPEAIPRPTAKDAYVNLWEVINGINSWDVNPWVWVIEFRRVA